MIIQAGRGASLREKSLSGVGRRDSFDSLSDYSRKTIRERQTLEINEERLRLIGRNGNQGGWERLSKAIYTVRQRLGNFGVFCVYVIGQGTRHIGAVNNLDDEKRYLASFAKVPTSALSLTPSTRKTSPFDQVRQSARSTVRMQTTLLKYRQEHYHILNLLKY
ncbi:uncharacterized protein LOC143178517 [Calliopsis andreniformis]|uniref:uncharacterized protein LOC143178517 n=1 Tax=Calliopsis andreniformis TaxID=337506 RepID=UPI003FCD2FD1